MGSARENIALTQRLLTLLAQEEKGTGLWMQTKNICGKKIAPSHYSISQSHTWWISVLQTIEINHSLRNKEIFYSGSFFPFYS